MTKYYAYFSIYKYILPFLLLYILNCITVFLFKSLLLSIYTYFYIRTRKYLKNLRKFSIFFKYSLYYINTRFWKGENKQ